MTQKAFIKILDEKGYSYEIEGDKVVVTHEGDVGLDALTSIPPGVEFKNRGYVDLSALTSLPPGVVFKNEGDISLDSLTSLPPGVVFKNRGDVDLKSIGGWFDEGEWFEYWRGNIEGIESNRLLNVMIKQGVLER